MKQVVLLGYGGPESREEVRPFLDRIVAGRPIPAQRYRQVLSNYEAIGGSSPFNALTREQARALQAELARRGVELPVHVAYRFAAPFIRDLAAASAEDETIAVILAAQQSEASWRTYVELFPQARFTAPFFDAPGFIRAHVERIAAAVQDARLPSLDGVELVFTAHSIPVAMAQHSPYVEQLHTGARAIAAHAGASSYRLAYTSRSGSPREAWLEPDVRELLRELAQAGTRTVLIDPLGFVCDHVEVLYDLDVDAAAAASSLGVRMLRARALNDHPAFIGAIADAVQACLA